MATVYVPPEIGIGLLDAMAAAGAKEVWLNPGTETDALVARARALGLNPSRPAASWASACRRLSSRGHQVRSRKP